MYAHKLHCDFLLSIMASVAGFYICKWLNRKHKKAVSPVKALRSSISQGFCKKIYNFFLNFLTSIDAARILTASPMRNGNTQATSDAHKAVPVLNMNQAVPSA